MLRILGVDFGRRRIGLAVSDELGLTAQGLPTVSVGGQAQAIAAVAGTAVRWQATEIVVGLPLNMDGSRGPMAETAEAFAEGLRQATGLPVHCWDERLTSISAHRTMRETGTRVRGKKGMVDRIAASLMLDAYLRARSRGKLGNGRP